MSYMTSFEPEEDFQGFIRGETRNQAGMTEPAYPNPANTSPGPFTGNYDTVSQPLDNKIEPILPSQSNDDHTNPETIDPRLIQQPNPRRQSPRHRAQTHPRGASHQYILRETSSRTGFLAPEFPTGLEERGSNAQAIKPWPQRRRRKGPKVDTGVQTDNKQGQPPTKKRRISRTPSNTASNSAATGEAQKMSNAADGHKETSDSADSRTPTVRRTDGNLEWFDEEEHKWKPAGYYHDYRAHFIALDAQQPGAPLWTEDMGTDYTSFSPLTQGWNEDPKSVIDSKGRQILLMEKRPTDWIRKPIYGPLIHNGLVMLDHENNPVRDIPGIPFTLEATAPGWLLEGLRRCMSMEIPDLKARSPATKEMAAGAKKLKSSTYLTNRMARWMSENHIKGWGQRPNAQKIERPTAAMHEYQGSEAARSGYLPPAGLQLGLDDPNSDLFTHANYLSTEVSYDPDSTYGMPYWQSYSDQEQTHSAWENTGIYADTEDGLFSAGDFRHIQPKTAAEIAFVQSVLEYTRAHYRMVMLREPPESSFLTSYAEQYREIQEDLERSWSLDLPPVKLRALGPVSGA